MLPRVGTTYLGRDGVTRKVIENIPELTLEGKRFSGPQVRFRLKDGTSNCMPLGRWTGLHAKKRRRR